MKTAAARSSLALLCLFIAMLIVTGLPGCGGCTSNPTADAEAERKRKEEEEKKQKEKPKPDFVAGRLMTQPNNIDTVESVTKPGHWTSATVEMTANNFDFLGEMKTDPFDLPGMPFRLGTSRPAPLPKGQKKYLELTFYVPPGRTGAKTSVRLLTGGGHREVLQELYTIRRQPAHQFYFMVLARNPDRYGFLETQHSIGPPSDDIGFGEGGEKYYKVLKPKIDKRVPLPSNPLTWTSIAYVLWDDVEPGLLTPEQQQALLDWLHWGGQLIVSGPDTLDTLRGSFLGPYLPATGGDPLRLTTETFAPVSQAWSLPDQPLTLVRPWTGQQLLVDPQADDTRVVIEGANSEPLVVERRAGRGGVLVTAFRLSQRELRQWKSFDNFLNGAILRRQPRIFSQSGDDGFHLLRVHWDQPFAHAYDPTRVSAVNYFTRDARIQAASPLWNWVLEGPLPDAEISAPPPMTGAAVPLPGDNDMPDSQGTLADDDALVGPGVAGWEDFNAAAETARRSLREASGITIPQASFVLMVLAAYLTVLVPVNWTVFRLLGRVEWAWIAAPILSIGFAMAVVRLAQLDIGFARSKTELAVVEFNGSYPRAHVTRYTALYTSLATRYDLRFEDASALVQPFPAFSSDEAQALLRGQSRNTVNFRRAWQAGDEDQAAASVTLEGFEVSSNSLGMVHSEHMFDLGGGLELKPGGRQVANNTFLRLEGAAAIRIVQPSENQPAGGYEVAWIGDLSPGAAKSLSFEPIEAGDLLAKCAEVWRPSALDLSELLRLSLTQFSPGETRLVAWTPEEIPGTSVEPAAKQTRHSSLIVAHLSHGPRPGARPDTTPFVYVKAAQDDLPEPDAEALDEFEPLPP
jgi:hypothetical protein